MQKLHYNTVKAVVDGLDIIFIEQKYADKAIERLLRSNSKWGSKDRKFIAEMVYDIVRWYRLVHYILDPSELSQPNHWQMIAAWFIINEESYPDWDEFREVNPTQVRSNFETAQQHRAIRESYPDWMDTLLSQELGSAIWEQQSASLNNQANVILRTNTLKTSVGELQKQLRTVDIDTQRIANVTHALALDKRQNIFKLPQFHEGLFEVQDAGSQLIAPYLQVQPGMRVIDACAGAGGKSLHLAAMMENKGRLIAMDVEQWKLNELKTRAKRAGVANIETRLIENSKTIKRLEQSADRLLLDVPCSGLGVLKRNPDAKWKLSLDFIEKIKITQTEILSSYSKMLKPGGQMVYATCSLLQSENRNQVDRFIAEHNNDFTFIADTTILPSEGFDGFYMARIGRK